MRKYFKILLAVFGWAGVAIAFLGFMVSLSEGIDGADIGVIVFFAVIGAGLIYASKQVGKADSDQEPVPVKIVPPDQVGNPAEADVKPETADLKQIVCASCGARTQVSAGAGGACEYCGSPVVRG